MNDLFTWQLALILLANHVVASGIKWVLTEEQRNHRAVKKLGLPAVVILVSVLLSVFVCAPEVLETIAQKIVFGVVVGGLHANIFSMAKGVWPALKALK